MSGRPPLHSCLGQTIVKGEAWIKLKAFCLYHSTVQFQVCAQVCFCKRFKLLSQGAELSTVYPSTCCYRRGYFLAAGPKELGSPDGALEPRHVCEAQSLL